jgi:hypothetical protein
MSEPRRLLEEGGSELERALLRSAHDDAPSPEGRHRTLMALGLAAGAGAAVTTTAATATGSTVLLKSGAAVMTLKWIGVGVLGGLATVGALAAVDAARAPSNPPAMVVATGHAPEAPVVAARPVPPAAREPEAPAAPIPADEAKTEPARAPAKASASAPLHEGLAGEVASLDAARNLLAGGDASGALRALDDHDRRFPGGVLGPESTMLRIEALAHRGDRAAAARLGEAYLDAHPRSPYASRIRSLLGHGGGPESPPNPPGSRAPP